MKKTPRLFVGQVFRRTLLGGGQIAFVIVKIAPSHYDDSVWIVRVTTYKRKRLKTAAYKKISLFNEHCSMDYIFNYFVPTGISLLENAP